MGWGQWGRREEQREDRRGVKRGRRECQGIMVCSEAFKNGDDVTQKWFAFLRPTPPFPGPLESLLLPMGVFFFFFKSTDTTNALDPSSRFMLWGSGGCMQGWVRLSICWPDSATETWTWGGCCDYRLFRNTQKSWERNLDFYGSRTEVLTGHIYFLRTGRPQLDYLSWLICFLLGSSLPE